MPTPPTTPAPNGCTRCGRAECGREGTIAPRRAAIRAVHETRAAMKSYEGSDAAVRERLQYDCDNAEDAYENARVANEDAIDDCDAHAVDWRALYFATREQLTESRARFDRLWDSLPEDD